MNSRAGLRVLLDAITASVNSTESSSGELSAWAPALQDPAGRIAVMTDRYSAKRAEARYRPSCEHPKTAAQFDLLASLHRSRLGLSGSWS